MLYVLERLNFTVKEVYVNLLVVKHPLYYENLYKCTNIELLSTHTLTRRYFPVCFDLNNETFR